MIIFTNPYGMWQADSCTVDVSGGISNTNSSAGSAWKVVQDDQNSSAFGDDEDDSSDMVWVKWHGAERALPNRRLTLAFPRCQTVTTRVKWFIPTVGAKDADVRVIHVHL